MFSSLLNQSKNDYIEGKLEESIGEYYHQFKFIKNLKEADPVQARLPFEMIIK